MITTLLEDKLEAVIWQATVTDVTDHVLQGVDKLLLDWNEMSQYPRVVIFCEEVRGMEEQIAPRVPQNRSYTVNIMLLCYHTDYDTVILQRDTIVQRIEAALISNKRLDSLADNTTNEKVWNSKVNRVRYSKSGFNQSYQTIAWLELQVDTST